MLNGILPVLPTLFDGEGQLNIDAQKQVVRFALASQASGIVFPGVASEYVHLTDEERIRLLTIVSDEVHESVPIVAGGSSTDPQVVIQFGKHALDCGVHHFMIMAPAHLGNDVSRHQEFFSEIARALPGAELMLQNAPSPIGAGLSPQSVSAVAQAIPQIRYVKEETSPSGPRITELIKTKPESVLGVFGGAGGRFLMDELIRGAVGAIPAVELTDLHVALFRAHQEHNDELARDLYRLSLPLLVAQSNYRMRLTKYVLRKRGVCESEYVRASELPQLDQFARQGIDQMLTDLQKSAANNFFRWTEASACTT